MNKEKKKNEELNKKIKSLNENKDNIKNNNEIENEEKNNKVIEDKININDNLNNLEEKNFYKALLEKDKEINLLKLKLSEFPFELNNEEKLMSIIIMTETEDVKYSCICKN